MAFKLYNDLKKRGLRPTTYTISHLLNTAAEAQQLQRGGTSNYYERGVWLLQEMEKLNVQPNVATLNGFLKLCVRTGHTREAIQFADKMHAEQLPCDAITYSLLLTAHATDAGIWDRSTYYDAEMPGLSRAKRGREQLAGVLAAWQRAKSAVKVDTRLGNTLLQAAKNSADPAFIFELRQELKDLHVHSDTRTYDILLNACYHIKRVDYALGLLSELQGQAQLLDTQLCNSLLRIGAAAQVAAEPIIVTERAVTPLADTVHSLVKEVLGAMEARGLSPSEDTFTLLISIHGRLGNVDKARDVAAQMQAQGFGHTIKSSTALLTAYRNARAPLHAFRLYEDTRARASPEDRAGADMSVFIKTLLKTLSASKRPDLAEKVVECARQDALAWQQAVADKKAASARKIQQSLEQQEHQNIQNQETQWASKQRQATRHLHAIPQFDEIIDLRDELEPSGTTNNHLTQSQRLLL